MDAACRIYRHELQQSKKTFAERIVTSLVKKYPFLTETDVRALVDDDFCARAATCNNIEAMAADLVLPLVVAYVKQELLKDHNSNAVLQWL